jgi:hypothetical protein
MNNLSPRPLDTFWACAPRSWKNQTEIRVEGQHFVQENEGKRIGRSIADWIDQKKV